jgi:hypothetical protein
MKYKGTITRAGEGNVVVTLENSDIGVSEMFLPLAKVQVADAWKRNLVGVKVDLTVFSGRPQTVIVNEEEASRLAYLKSL